MQAEGGSAGGRREERIISLSGIMRRIKRGREVDYGSVGAVGGKGGRELGCPPAG